MTRKWTARDYRNRHRLHVGGFDPRPLPVQPCKRCGLLTPYEHCYVCNMATDHLFQNAEVLTILARRGGMG